MEKQFLSIIDRESAELIVLANTIWESPETAFEEFKAKDALVAYLRSRGFAAEERVADLPTAFIATFGTGHPVIGFIAEFDALPGLSQQACVPYKAPVEGVNNGHGCGHHLYGVSAVAAALAVKSYLEATGKSGTVKVLGCPGEEGGSGKAYMARDGAFKGLDVAMGGHPEEMWAVRTRGSLACCSAVYRFEGRSSHAGAAPHLGRSALDAVELMNVSVNFLREHIPYDNRVHYAITDSGGIAPNVVQSHAEAVYMMRAPNNEGVKALYERVTKCARGAAMATETTMAYEFLSASSNLITIPILQQTLYQAMNDIPLPTPTKAELAYGQALAKTIIGRDLEQDIYPDRILPIPEHPAAHFGSTDTGDVSWNCPTVQMHVGSWIRGTPSHSWQTVSQGKNGFAVRAMLYAGKALALAAMRIMENPALAENAWREHMEKTNGKYISLIPPDLMPRF